MPKSQNKAIKKGIKTNTVNLKITVGMKKIVLFYQEIVKIMVRGKTKQRNPSYIKTKCAKIWQKHKIKVLTWNFQEI